VKFLNEDIRANFHLLPIDTQKGFMLEDAYFTSIGMTLTVLFADPESSEISVRVDKEFNDTR
jgi:hypothetical protein